MVAHAWWFITPVRMSLGAYSPYGFLDSMFYTVVVPQMHWLASNNPHVNELQAGARLLWGEKGGNLPPFFLRSKPNASLVDLQACAAKLCVICGDAGATQLLAGGAHRLL